MQASTLEKTTEQTLAKELEFRRWGYTVQGWYRSPFELESRAGVFDMHLTFHTQSGELLKWQGFTPVGKIGFDFTADRKPEGKPANR